MKQKWIALAVLGAMLVQVAPISSMTAAALETTAISDITATDAVLLKYNKHDTYVEITGFRADETDIVLPDTIDGLPVTTIQEGAFFSSQLTSIYIPESVTQIGGIAFQACADLQRIEVDEHNPAYTSVDGVLYDKEEKILYAYPNALAENENTLKSSYSVPDGVETIAQGVFFYNQSLTNLTLPHSIQVLEADAFSDTALRDIYYDGTQADWNAIAKKVPTGGNVEQPFREFYAEMHYLRENTSTETTAAITTIQTTTESTEGTSQTTSEITTSIPVSTATTTQEQRTSTESETATTITTTSTASASTETSTSSSTKQEVPDDALYGDIDLDGRIAINDAVLLNKYVAGVVILNTQQMRNGDCYQDSSSGTIDMQDTTSLLRFLVHITTTLPEQDTSQKGTLTPTTAIHNVYFKNESEIDSMPAVISTMDEWNAYGEQFAVELGSKNSLLNTEPFCNQYTEEFFQSHVLLVNISPVVPAGTQEFFSIDDVFHGTDGKMHIKASNRSGMLMDCVGIDSRMLLQVTIPKTQYHGEEVVWDTNWIFPSYDMLFNITTATEQGWDKAKSSDSALVFSTAEELEEQITSLLGEETTENLKKYYDSEFFASHVLFVDLVAKPDGNDYENIICEVSQDKTGTLQITYQRELCNGFHSKSIDLLLVALPKSQWNGKAPVWNSKTLDTSSCQLSVEQNIQAVTKSGWNRALSSRPEMVLTSEQDFEDSLAPLYENAVAQQLRDHFNDAFFADYVLFARPTVKCNSVVYAPEKVVQQDNGYIEIFYSGTEIDGTSGTGIDLLWVAVPIEQWNGKKPTWKEVGETEISASLRYYDVLNISSMKKQWISSREELRTVLQSANITDEYITADTLLQLYPESFFEKKALYLSVDDDIAGTSRTVFRVTQNENTRKITVSCRKKQPVSCDGVMQISMLAVPKNIAENAEVAYADYNDEFLLNNGAWAFTTIPDTMGKGFAVNQYSFGNYSEVILYSTSPSGIVLYHNFNQLASLPLDEAFPVFSNSQAVWTKDDSGNNVCSFGDLQITAREKELEVSYPYNKTGDRKTVTVPLAEIV